MSARSTILILAVLSLISGCHAQEPEGPITINPIARPFPVEFQKTWAAVLSVLNRNHYEVATMDSRSGLITTRWREVGRSEPRGLFRKTYPLKARLTVWVKPRGINTYVTITNEEVVVLSETKTERYRTSTELEHEILEQVATILGVP